MATTIYATMLVAPGNVEAVKRYLYADTEVIEAAPVVKYAEGGSRTVGDLVFLILRTEADGGPDYAATSQQQQIDRLASGLHGATGGFTTRYGARKHAESRALDNDWGLGGFAPFVVSAVSA